MTEHQMDMAIHMLQNTEKITNRSNLLLSRLANRCDAAASGIYERDRLPTGEDQETADFLYELAHTLRFISETLAADSDYVCDVLAKIDKQPDGRK